MLILKTPTERNSSFERLYINSTNDWRNNLTSIDLLQFIEKYEVAIMKIPIWATIRWKNNRAISLNNKDASDQNST